MIILMGYMGSGKSSVSKYLNEKYNLRCCDLDDYIESGEKKSIKDIFKTKGEIYFRKIEHEYLKQLLKEKNFDILSLGGGTPCYAGNIELIKKQKMESFYLKVDLLNLTDRLFNQKKDRPLISNIATKMDLKDFIRKHLFEREYYYRQAKYMINVTHLSIKETAENIMNNLK